MKKPSTSEEPAASSLFPQGRRAALSDPWSDLEIPRHISAESERALLHQLVERVRKLHEDSRWPELFEDELVPSSGLTEDRINEIESQLGVPLPAHYRVFLRTVGYLDIYDGFSIWRPEVICVETYRHASGHRYLAIGDCWRRADGDSILIDLDSESTPVVVWCHDLRLIEPLAPTVGLAVFRIMEYLASADQYQLTIEAIRQRVRYAQRPWWRQFLRALFS